MPSSQIGFSLLLVKLAGGPWVSSMFCILLVSSPYPRLCSMAIPPWHRSLMIDSHCVWTGCLRKFILSFLLVLPLLSVAILQVSWKKGDQILSCSTLQVTFTSLFPFLFFYHQNLSKDVTEKRKLRDMFYLVMLLALFLYTSFYHPFCVYSLFTPFSISGQFLAYFSRGKRKSYDLIKKIIKVLLYYIYFECQVDYHLFFSLYFFCKV